MWMLRTRHLRMKRPARILAQDESQLKLDPPPAPAAEDEAAAPDYAAFKGVKFSE